jgi:UDP-N-acetylglucosamine--N-acetylmuramyl-(pentapeptide) pyrophosphoryl-undecaprenol N-acetylglucosamine transferase
MNIKFAPNPFVAIACGGTGGHVFPGLAVARQLTRRGCRVAVLISPKQVDQEAVRESSGIEVVVLPAIGLRRGSEMEFFRGFGRSYGTAKRFFNNQRPDAVLAMGGFTSAPPVLAGKRLGARTFLHESNTIPGRANRWLSWVVNRACVGFPCAATRLHNRAVQVTGTPVRPQFQALDAGECRVALGLDPSRPVVVVMGGSQGASGINDLVLAALPITTKIFPDLQWFHLTGPQDEQKVQAAYAVAGIKAQTHAFFGRMELALGAATAAISRAGASSLAEYAAMRVPAVLVPYPAATDNHQYYNARAYVETGAARLLEQKDAGPERLVQTLVELIQEGPARKKIQTALAAWHAPHAAAQISVSILETIGAGTEANSTSIEFEADADEETVVA